MLELAGNNNSVALIPEQLHQLCRDVSLRALKVYYISDLHLDTWYDEFGKSVGLSFEDYTKGVVDELFSGSFLQDIRDARAFIVLFLGDIAESIKSCEIFYSTFISKWDEVDKQLKEEYDFLVIEKIRLWLEDEDNVDLRILRDYKCKHAWCRELDWGSFAMSDRLRRKDIKKSFERLIYRVELLLQIHGCKSSPRFANRRLYAVLGNHEMAEFCGKSIIDFNGAKDAEEFIECCYSAYEGLFNKFSIRLLFPGATYNHKSVWSYLGDTSKGLVIAGLCGYARPNLYNVFGNIEEIFDERIHDWYMSLLSDAQKDNSVLLMCSHFPLQSGVASQYEMSKDNIYYFCGHTHRNEKEFLSDTSAVISDNQIGYGWNSKNKFQLKCVCLYDKYNPYAELDDGIYRVSIDSYAVFCDFCICPLSSRRMLSKYVENGCIFWLVKSEDYYGFFLENVEKKKMYIVNGASVRSIKYAKSIYNVAYRFDDVVQMYIKAFKGIRDYQNNISEFIRSFGGDGTIHGLIVDIDYFNHIGVNPITGDVDFYYSPEFGVKKSYVDISSLLEENSFELYDKYCQALSSGRDVSAVSVKYPGVPVDDFITVPRGGDSFYGASRYMSPIHALFDVHILKVWDEKFIFKVISSEAGNYTPAITSDSE